MRRVRLPGVARGSDDRETAHARVAGWIPAGGRPRPIRIVEGGAPRPEHAFV